MIPRIIENVDGRENRDTENWYQAKVIEMARFMVRRIKEDNAALKTIEAVKDRRLEVIVK